MTNDIKHFDFFTAGNATFTVTNPAGEHYTFKISRPRSADETCPLFVSLLNGSDNESSYVYMGILREDGTVKRTAKSRVGDEATSMKVVRWALSQFKKGVALPQGYTCQHEGQCCRCGRKLTTPESIDSGIGPECAAKVGAFWGRREPEAPIRVKAASPAPKGERILQPVFFAGENSNEDEWDLYATKLPLEIDGEEMIESRLREKREFAEKESAAYTFKVQRDVNAEGKLF